jgi:DNA-binding transcriptional ArsR family regulator
MSCPPETFADHRPLLSRGEALELASLFEILASETRLRLIHALMIMNDPCMSDLADAVGMKPQAVSNQLRRLVDLGVLDTRRHGNHVHYRIAEPCVAKLLHHGLCINAEHPLKKATAS